MVRRLEERSLIQMVTEGPSDPFTIPSAAGHDMLHSRLPSAEYVACGGITVVPAAAYVSLAS